jgi:hypothetical protein
VSTRARSCSGTRSRALVEQRVEVGTELLGVDRRCVREGRHGPRGRNEAPSADRGQLAYFLAVPGHEERLAPINGPHDLAALVAELALRDLPCHAAQCSTRATWRGGPLTCEGTFYIWLEFPEGVTFETLLSEHRVVLAPGEGFGPSGVGRARLSLAVDDETLELGLERLVAAFDWVS